MSYSIAQLKVDLEGRLHGTSLNRIVGANDLISRAGRQLVGDCDPAETVRVAYLPNAFYDNVFGYACPSDLKGDRVIDIRPVADMTSGDRVSQTYTAEFESYRTSNTFSVSWQDGIKILRLSKPLTAGILLNECESTTVNGIWAGSGVSDLTADATFKVTGGAALRFDATTISGYIQTENATSSVGGGFPILFGSTTSTITAGGLMDAVDLSTHENLSSLFVWLFVEDASKLTSLTLSWGEDSTKYWTRTVTTGHFEPFRNGWNLLRFDWNGATEVSTPNSANITFLKVAWVTTAATNNFRVDSVYSRLPSYFEVVYYSKYLFRNPSGTWTETVTSDDDTVNLDTDSYNLLLDLCEVFAFQQLQGDGIVTDATVSQNRYVADLANYKNKYRSEGKPKQQSYYRM